MLRGCLAKLVWVVPRFLGQNFIRRATWMYIHYDRQTIRTCKLGILLVTTHTIR